MLRIYPITLLLARDAATAAKLITRHDTDLARQLRRAGASVPLNCAEGYGSLGGHKRQRYGNALGSTFEVRACLDTAAAMEYIPAPSDETIDRANHIIAVLRKLIK